MPNSKLSIMSKGQLISKAIYGLLTFPKKCTDEFVFLVFFSSCQTKQIRPFVFWENLWFANLFFGFISPLVSTNCNINGCEDFW